MIQRKIARLTTSPLQPGFLGPGHRAAAVVDGNHFAQTDPFLLLMDDQLNLPGGPPVGGPHPHAGFETVTLVLQGNDNDWETGSLELMTAGKGIIHTEEITAQTQLRILQLWLVLPPEKRWAEPLWQQILLEDVPVKKTADGEIRVYSGASHGLVSPLQNHTPFSLVDLHLTKEAAVVQDVPASYSGFVYVLEGTLWAGDTKVEKGQAAWLDEPQPSGESAITFRAGELGARLVFYAGEPQQVPVVSHGPFVGDSREDIQRLYQEYRQGKMPHLNELPPSRKVQHRKRAAVPTS
ncbi:hypothetical protein HNQ92_001240 [Rhabdobacter roseus]|uniref:Pirin family protein n=1 Tax=Rhabdobacter roseus TaxID=1655419 RepID=A0A840TI20_9BACT|nr:pirin-like C-terminal cupin domain-containing protein [Rhabdobacter roseus]MBB5283114.1 hypothetical protein [Rhabdobacter roseus]